MIQNTIFGAIIGDMVGSVHEFNSYALKGKTYDFPLWKGKAKLPFFKHESQRTGSTFTDDTVTGLALANALVKIKDFQNEKVVKQAFIDSMKELCPKYEWTGFGNGFWNWVSSPNNEKCNQPYNSYGNGSAMRVFPIGLAFDNIEDTRRIARWSAEVTHNHPEGVKGAEVTASVMFLARQGKSKQEIKDYVIKEFSDGRLYLLDRTCDEIRPEYSFNEICQTTVPEAVQCFLEAKDFEEAIRLSVSLGGDADTIGCITGAMAACMYPIPKKMIHQAYTRLTKELRIITEEFSSCF